MLPPVRPKRRSRSRGVSVCRSNTIERINYDSASLKINVALSELPNFRACPGFEAGPQHRGTIHICPDLDTIERAFDDAKYGRPYLASSKARSMVS